VGDGIGWGDEGDGELAGGGAEDEPPPDEDETGGLGSAAQPVIAKAQMRTAAADE